MGKQGGTSLRDPNRITRDWSNLANGAVRPFPCPPLQVGESFSALQTVALCYWRKYHCIGSVEETKKISRRSGCTEDIFSFIFFKYEPLAVFVVIFVVVASFPSTPCRRRARRAIRWLCRWECCDSLSSSINRLPLLSPASHIRNQRQYHYNEQSVCTLSCVRKPPFGDMQYRRFCTYCNASSHES